jgi:hypothetical protein
VPSCLCFVFGFEEGVVNFDLGYVLGLYGLVVLFGCVYWWQRRVDRRRRRRGKGKLRIYSSAALLGNALHSLQSIAEPQVRHVVAEELKEEAEDEDVGGPEDPTAHLLRQARRIRRGEDVGRLTAIRR